MVVLAACHRLDPQEIRAWRRSQVIAAVDGENTLWPRADVDSPTAVLTGSR